MGSFKIKLLLYTLALVLLTSLTYLIFLFQISGNIMKSVPLYSLRYPILVIGLTITTLALIAACFITFFLTRNLTCSINDLINATQAISKKNFNQRLKIHTYKEIEELIIAFNYMSQQLKNFEQETKKRSQTLENAVKERTKELSYIYTLGREVSSSLDLDSVLDSIVKRTAEVLNLKICTILLVDEVLPNRMRVFRAQGINFKKIERQSIRKGEGLSGWIWENEESLLIENVNQDVRFIDRKKEKYYTGSSISAPLQVKGKIIGVIHGNNKINGGVFKTEELLLLEEFATESAIAIENALLYKSLKEIYLHTISALARALEAKDHYSRSHSENVTKYAAAIAKELDLDAGQIEILRQACQLHDLGKIGIHDYILTKAGKLTPEEWEEIKTHALRGAQILQPIGFLNDVANLVRQHHERFDGNGYPLKFSGEDIQLGARIMAIADAFDAMLSERPYRKALSLPQAIAELKANSGKQFDPVLIKIFLKLLESNPKLAKT